MSGNTPWVVTEHHRSTKKTNRGTVSIMVGGKAHNAQKIVSKIAECAIKVQVDGRNVLQSQFPHNSLRNPLECISI